jgi:hypothetical protein
VPQARGTTRRGWRRRPARKEQSPTGLDEVLDGGGRGGQICWWGLQKAAGGGGCDRQVEEVVEIE